MIRLLQNRLHTIEKNQSWKDMIPTKKLPKTRMEPL
jgi:hypothetical protein